MKPRRALLLALLCLAALAVLTVAPKRALAGGNFTVKTTEVTESQGEWHVKVRIDMTRAPGMMHIPMRFTFSKDAVDERAIMTRGADPVHHRNVLEVSPKQIQSMDVDFADPSGKVFKSTYFEFDLRRDGGYFEAGEYQVSLSGPDGDVGGRRPRRRDRRSRASTTASTRGRRSRRTTTRRAAPRAPRAASRPWATAARWSRRARSTRRRRKKPCKGTRAAADA
jgi:hypothetical protein